MSERILEILVFALGGTAYGLMEILFRGHTHWTMVITGGACVLTLFMLQDWLMSIPLIGAAAMGALVITVYEFFVGIIVNLQFGWHVWDYSAQPGNIMGQICPLFTVIWFLLCFVFFGIVRIFT